MAQGAQAVAVRRSNKRMRATADTTAVKFLLGAGRRVMRGVGPPIPANVKLRLTSDSYSHIILLDGYEG
jgi:hypothetical protein